MAYDDPRIYIERWSPALYASADMDFYIDDAMDEVSEDFFGDVFPKAVALMAVHLYAIDESRPDGNAGFITGKTEGRVSVRYYKNNKGALYSTLTTTRWGERLLSLAHKRMPMVSVGNPFVNLG